jgi:hypothetical protein
MRNKNELSILMNSTVYFVVDNALFSLRFLYDISFTPCFRAYFVGNYFILSKSAALAFTHWDLSNSATFG